jgi:Holliday junction resolvasome RuvABC endonuclease subunit
MPLVIGIDPGERTGLALVRVGATLPVVVLGTLECPLRAIRAALSELLGWNAKVDGVVVEGWEYQGPERAKGCTAQAYAAGVCVGAALGWEVAVVEIPRHDVLAGLKCRASAGKGVVQAAVLSFARFTSVLPKSEHTWDAVAAAIVGAGRLPKATEGR